MISKRRSADGGEPGAHPPFDVGQSEGMAIGARDPQRLFRHIDAGHARIAALGGDGEGDGAAPGAQVQHPAAASTSSSSACSTSSSVSGRGTRTAGVTLSGSDQNSRGR